MPTVAVVVIGDEILTGKYPEENAAWAIQRLRAVGADLRRVVVIPDSVAGIAAEVRAAADAHDWVVTSGGVGPTHDDLTFEGVAAAFDLPLVVDDGLAALLDRYNIERNPAAMRMATIPAGGELVYGDSHYPVVRVRNVFVLPGVPKLFRAKFAAIEAHFAGSTLYTARVRTDEPEHAIAARLNAVVAAWPTVQIGSYPRFEDGAPYVLLTLEARDPAALDGAAEALASALGVPRLP